MKRRLKWIGLISLLPIGALLAFLAFIAYRETVASSELKRMLDGMRQAGQPFDNESIATYFEKVSHKEGTNAWNEVLALGQASRELFIASDLPSVGAGKLPHDLRPGIDWPDEPRVAKYLEEVRPIIKRVQLASAFPKPVWMQVRFDGFSTLLQQSQDSRLPVGILNLDATHALYHKESERALNDIVAMRSVADAFDWPFCMMTQWIAIGIRGSQQACINRSLGMDVWNDEQMATLSAQVDKPLDIAKAWRAGYAGELAMFNASLDNLRGSLPLELNQNPLYRLPIMPSTRLEILRAFEDCQHCADQGVDGLVERAKAILNSQFKNQRISLTNVYLSNFLPSLKGYAEYFEGQEVNRRLTYTSLAVKRFQLKNKRWPKNLTELSDVGLVLNDWSTTKREPFGYEVEADRAFVWFYEPLKGAGVSPTRPVIDQEIDLYFLVSIR